MRLTLRPSPPFDFGLSAAVFAAGDPLVRHYEAGTFRQVVRVGSRLILATVTGEGSVEEPRLAVELWSPRPLPRPLGLRAAGVIGSIFNTGFDLAPFYRHAGKDRILARICRKLRGLKSPSTPSVFEALVCSVVEQQISITTARAIQTRLSKAFGGRLQKGQIFYYAFPTANALARLPFDEIRRCGLSRTKARCLAEISARAASGRLDLDVLPAEDDETVIRRLTRLAGVGLWTAELTMLRGMRRFGAIPADDLGLRRDVAFFYAGGKNLSGREVRSVAEPWGEWRGLAGYYLMTARNLGLAP